MTDTNTQDRSSFSGHLGFILASAGSAVGLGNIWRFPYLAAKDGGGLFIVVYLILACLVPIIILPYYCAIGGWVLKYLSMYVTGHGAQTVADGFFGGYISKLSEPIIWFIIFFALTAAAIISGVEKGIEKVSKILMPILVVMVIGISLFSLTLSYTDAEGVTRTGLQGLKVYVVPSFEGLTVSKFLFKWSRLRSSIYVSIYTFIFGVIVCLGYNKLYFELHLPTGTAQVLDLMDYISNSVFMPLVALSTSILIGWIAKPEYVIDEVTLGGVKFSRAALYKVMIKYIVPIMLVCLLINSAGIIKF